MTHLKTLKLLENYSRNYCNFDIKYSMVYRRNSIQRREDYEFIRNALDEGIGWDDIHESLMSQRSYYVGVPALKAQYHNDTKAVIVANAPEQHVFDKLIDYEVILEEAYEAWLRSCGTIEKKIVSEYFSVSKGHSSSEVKTSMEGVGDPKFLEIYLKALKQREDLLRPQKASLEGNTFNFNEFKNTYTVVDKQQVNVKPPIRSEEEAKEYGRTLDGR